MAEPERHESQADVTVASRRRDRQASAAGSSRGAAAARRRLGGAELVETLDRMVSQLIKENRSLKRQLAKLEAGGATAVSGAAERTLRSLQRKVQRAVAPAPATRRRRPPASTTAARARRT